MSPSASQPIRPARGRRGKALIRLTWLVALAIATVHPLLSQNQHRIFVTSVTGSGDLSSWADADGETGLRAADAICRARASAAGLQNSETFVAWLSDSSDDAYCRAHGLSGTIQDNCGEAALPTNAGPWVRWDSFPFGGPLPQLLSPSFAALAPVAFDEFGQPTVRLYFTGTNDDGAAMTSQALCNDWTLNSDDRVQVGYPTRTGNAWNSFGTSRCLSSNALLCLRQGPGPVLGGFQRRGLRAFPTASSGTGDLSSWSDAAGNTGLAAADAVCRAEAARAGLDNASLFEAWLSDGSKNAIDRLQNDGPWVRLDGVPLADSRTDLTDGDLFAPLNRQADGTYQINAGVWTGTGPTGDATPNNCQNWTSSAFSDEGTSGSGNDSSTSWTTGSNPNACSSGFKLYCLEDAPFVTPTCPQNATTLCLGAGERFAVNVEWQSSSDSGSAQAVDIGRQDSGLFTFFDPNNLELLIKVLDGCALTGHYWVFYGATTDVAFQIRVEDVQTGLVREYTNPLGTSAEPIKDLMAFPCGG